MYVPCDQTNQRVHACQILHGEGGGEGARGAHLRSTIGCQHDFAVVDPAAGRGGLGNMKSMRLPSAAILSMTYFHRVWGEGHGPLSPLDPLLILRNFPDSFFRKMEEMSNSITGSGTP